MLVIFYIAFLTVCFILFYIIYFLWATEKVVIKFNLKPKPIYIDKRVFNFKNKNAENLFDGTNPKIKWLGVLKKNQMENKLDDASIPPLSSV